MYEDRQRFDFITTYLDVKKIGQLYVRKLDSINFITLNLAGLLPIIDSHGNLTALATKPKYKYSRKCKCTMNLQYALYRNDV